MVCLSCCIHIRSISWRDQTEKNLGSWRFVLSHSWDVTWWIIGRITSLQKPTWVSYNTYFPAAAGFTDDWNYHLLTLIPQSWHIVKSRTQKIPYPAHVVMTEIQQSKISTEVRFSILVPNSAIPTHSGISMENHNCHKWYILGYEDGTSGYDDCGTLYLNHDRSTAVDDNKYTANVHDAYTTINRLHCYYTIYNSYQTMEQQKLHVITPHRSLNLQHVILSKICWKFEILHAFVREVSSRWHILPRTY